MNGGSISCSSLVSLLVHSDFFSNGGVTDTFTADLTGFPLQIDSVHFHCR